MSYYNRFASSLAFIKSKQGSNGNGVTPSSSPLSAAASPSTSTNNSHHGINTSKTRSLQANKVPPPGLPKMGSQSTSPWPAPSRKRATSNPPYSVSPPFTPSNNLMPGFTVKTNPGKLYPSAANGRTVNSKSTNKIPKTGVDRKKNINIQKSASIAGAKDYVMHEGPIEFPEENFDFYKILSRPKAWEVDEDYDASKSSCTEDSEELRAVSMKSSPSYVVKTKDSDVWGSLRTSTAGESSIPSLTSMLDDRKAFIEEENETESGIKDENNNVLSTITNSIFESLGVFNASRNNDDNNNEKEKESVAKEDGREAMSFSSSRKQGQVNSSLEKINAQSSHNNIHNSPLTVDTPVGREWSSLRQDSGLIPVKIEEQLHQAFHSTYNITSSHVSGHEACFTKLHNNEDSLVRNPSLAKINPADKRKNDEISDSFSQLARDASISEEKADIYFDVSCDRVSSSLSCSTGIDETYYSEAGTATDEEFDSQETQTQSVNCQDISTGTESIVEMKKKKMKNFVMSINNAVCITSEEQKRKSVRIKGIMKTSRPGTPNSLHSTSSTTCLTEETIRQRAIRDRRLPQTFRQVGADYGFPSDISISRFIGDLVPMKWASSEKPTEGTVSENGDSQGYMVSDGGEAASLINTAYSILSAGLKLASSLIGDESELEPREDMLYYNGYRIHVFGRKLLLESIHVNCDFNIGPSRICSNHSLISFKPQTLSRETLEQSCEGRRIRIVIRVSGSLGHKENSVMENEHQLRLSDGKWTLIYGREETGDNFVSIQCPTGVHAESLVYGLAHGLLIVDTP